MAFAHSGTTITQSNETAKSIVSIGEATDSSILSISSHGYAVGDLINITGTTDYNGDHIITAVTTHSATIAVAFTSSQSGSAARGDNDLSGLASISGVTRTIIGDDANSLGVAIYIFSNRRLVINGSLKFIPENEQIFFSENCPNPTLEIGDGGSLIIGEGTENDDGSTTYSIGNALTFGQKGTSHANADNGHIVVESGGSLEINGSTIITQSTNSFKAGSRVRLTNLVWHNALHTDTQNPSSYPAFLSPRVYSTDCEITNVRLIGGVFQVNAGTGITIDGVTPERMQAGISINETGIAVSSFFVVKGLDGGHGGRDAAMFNGQKLRVTNSRKGTDISLDIANISHFARAFGVGEVTQEVEFEIKDADGDAVEDARIFARDYDNDDRENWSLKNDYGGNSSAAVNYDDDRTYNDVTDSDGKIDYDVLLAAKVYNTTAGGTTKEFSYRTKDGDDTDAFDFNIWSYLHLPTTVATVLKGLAVLAIPWTLFTDPNISQTTKATVAAYSGISIDHTDKEITISASHTLDEIYDYIKYNKTLSDNIELPSITTLAVTPNGNQLQFGDYSIIVSGSSTILSKGSKFKNITSDGTVTTTSNGSISIPFIDSTGTSINLTCNVGSVKIFYQIDPDDNSTATEGYITTDSDGKSSLTGVPTASHVYLAVKKDGYDYYKTNFDPAETQDISLPLSLLNAIDLTISLSAYSFDSDATDSEDNIYFDYNSSGKSFIVFGEIDLDPSSNPRKLSNRIFDHLFSTEEGLKFLTYWDRDDDITELSGRPFIITTDKIAMNIDNLDITRMSSMTSSEKSYFGQYVATHEDERYRSPQSNNDNVSIASESNILEVSSDILDKASEKFIEDLEANSTKLELIKTNTNSIKTTTDKLSFNDDNDIVSTLDGEEVSTEATSIDISSLATQTSVDAIDTVVDAIKAKTDDISITDSKIRASISNDEVNIGKVKDTAITDIGDFKVDISDIAVAIEDGLLDEDDGRALLAAIKEKIIAALEDESISPSLIATEVWSVALSTLTTEGEIGHKIKENLSSLVSNSEFMKKLEMADLTIENDQAIFSYDGDTLLTFNKKTAVDADEANWSGGRELVSE